jgi:hypothetical protein
MPVFRVRAMAFTVLRNLDVKVDPLNKTKPFEFVSYWWASQWGVDPLDRTKAFEFEVDKDSAVKALKPELQIKDKQHVKQAIEAISRIGGPAAKAELKRFVAEQECVQDTQEIVVKAKEALSRMDAGKE